MTMKTKEKANGVAARIKREDIPDLVTSAPVESVAVVIHPLIMNEIIVELRSLPGASLIVHHFSEESIQTLLKRGGEETKVKTKRGQQDPEADYHSASYKMADGKTWGVPAEAFKKAAVSACRLTAVPMTTARGAFFVVPSDASECVAIRGKWQMRRDIVRVGKFPNKQPMPRFRPEALEWEATLKIRYNPRIISAESIVNLFNIAGTHVGICERRPEKEGLPHGQFQALAPTNG